MTEPSTCRSTATHPPHRRTPNYCPTPESTSRSPERITQETAPTAWSSTPSQDEHPASSSIEPDRTTKRDAQPIGHASFSNHQTKFIFRSEPHSWSDTPPTSPADHPPHRSPTQGTPARTRRNRCTPRDR